MTDFFMKFLKKNKLIRILFLIILFNFGHSNATNGNINVSQFELEQIQKDIYINFHQNIIFVTKGESKKLFFKEIKKNTLSDKLKKFISFFYN